MPFRRRPFPVRHTTNRSTNTHYTTFRMTFCRTKTRFRHFFDCQFGVACSMFSHRKRSVYEFSEDGELCQTGGYFQEPLLSASQKTSIAGIRPGVSPTCPRHGRLVREKREIEHSITAALSPELSNPSGIRRTLSYSSHPSF